MATVPFNFLGLPSEFSAYKKARYAVLPIPYDATVSFRTGSREGPFAILYASRQVELFDPALGREIHHPGVATLDPIETEAVSPDEMMKSLFAAAKKVVRDGKFLLSLGGEHSISAPLVRAVQTRYKKLSVLHLDAHSDMRDTWQGSKCSHACVMKRIQELGCKTVSFGIRNSSEGEVAYIRKTKQTVITAEEIYNDKSSDWIARTVEPLTDYVYVTIDIDGFDPAYAPGTGTPEPGGLDWYQVNEVLKVVAKTRTIVAADIVEVLPVPGQAVTEFLAAKLAARIIALTQ